MSCERADLQFSSGRWKRSFAQTPITSQTKASQLKIPSVVSAYEPKQLEALGYKFVESDLPPIVRDWCVGNSVLCLIEGEFSYSDLAVWKQLQRLLVPERVRGQL